MRDSSVDTAIDAAIDTAVDAEPPLDGRQFRDILGKFATGVVAITGLDPATGRPVGLAVNSFTSVSLDPPLVAFCVAHTSSSWPLVRASRRYCLNILGDDQRQVTAQVAAKGGDKFRGLDWFSSPGGMPVLPGSMAWLECSLYAEHPAGDHVIIVARVHHADLADGRQPLVFFGSRYGTFSTP